MQGGGRRELQLGGSVLEVPDAGIKRASPSSAIKGDWRDAHAPFFGGSLIGGGGVIWGL